MTIERYSNNNDEQHSIILANHEFKPGIIDDLPISRLRPSGMPIRLGAEEIESLARSIKEKGLLQPIIVWPKDDDYFEVVAGNRRYTACKLLGWRKIPCHIVELNDKEAYEISLIENIQRRTMDPIEEAEAYKKYILEFGWGGISHLAKRVGKSISYISKRISLLDLPQDIVAKIKLHEISPSVAEELLRLDDNNAQSELAHLISTRHISIRRVRQLALENARNGIEEESNDMYLPDGNGFIDIERAKRAYDKAITSIRITLDKIAAIMEDLEDNNWIVYEMLMQQKNTLHNQIDLLMKERRRLERHSFAIVQY